MIAPKPSRAVDVEGSDAVSRVLLALLNDFPGLKDKVIQFSTLEEDKGLGFFPTSGAAILSNVEDILGKVNQSCLYPFDVIYRASTKSENQKIGIKEFLDGLGKWLERQPVVIDGITYKLDSYPALQSGNREIKNINRATPAYLYAIYENGVEDWRISLSLKYDNEFTK